MTGDDGAGFFLSHYISTPDSSPAQALLPLRQYGLAAARRRGSGVVAEIITPMQQF